MNQKHKYFISTALLAGTSLFIAFFDYITFFEKRFGLDKLTYQSTDDYHVYSENMTPVKIVFSSVFFLSLISIVLYSFWISKYREQYGIPGYLLIGIIILTVVVFLLILFGGIFASATVI